MAPGKKRPTARGDPKASARDKRVDAFLKDFDREVLARLAQVRADGDNMKKEVEDMSDIDLLRLPLVIREMKWVDFVALEDSDNALEKVASSEVIIADITQLASKAIQTPIRIAKKVKQAIETIDEEMEASLLPTGKKSRQENQAAAGVAGKGQTSTKRPPNSKRTRPPSSRAKNFPKSRLSKVNPVTPDSRGNPTKAAAPLFTPAGRFDSSLFRMPGLRAPGVQERVFSVSVNGSPLTDRSEVSLVVPLGEGESIHIGASGLLQRDLAGLRSQALDGMKKMSSQLVELCSRMGSHE